MRQLLDALHVFCTQQEEAFWAQVRARRDLPFDGDRDMFRKFAVPWRCLSNPKRSKRLAGDSRVAVLDAKDVRDWYRTPSQTWES